MIHRRTFGKYSEILMPRNYDPWDKNENENKSTHKNVWECEDGKKKKVED